jgi:PAS domain S-box-containing protein
MSTAVRSARATAIAAGTATFAVALAGLASRGRPVHVTLWVAIAMLVGGAGIVVVAFAPAGHPLRRIVALLASVIALIFAAVLAGVAFGARVDADAFRPWGHLPAAAIPASTGLLGASAILCAAAALACASAGIRARRFAGALATVPLLVGLTVCIGYLYPEPLLPLPGWRPVTLAGGAGSLAWGVGIIAAQGGEAWPLRVLAGRSVRATLLRWFLPFTLAVVVVTDVATVHLFTRFSPAIGSVLNTLVSVAGTALVTTYLAGVIGGRLDRAEERATRLNRLYAVVSRVNELITRVRDVEALLRGSCEVLIESGGFTMAWAGWLDPGTGIVTPVASAGAVGTFLDGLVISTTAGPSGGGPAAAALREERPFVSREIALERGLTTWRDHSLASGFVAAAAFPLTTHGTPTHVISIYAGDTRWFRDEEVRLLENLASDLSFALGALAEARQRTEAEARLAESESQFRALIETSSDLITIAGADGVIRYESPSIRALLGFEPEERLGGHVSDLVHPDDLPAVRGAVEATFSSARRSEPIRCRLRHKSGTWRVVETVAWNMLDVRGVDGVAIHSRDITDRQGLEAQLRQAQKMEAVGQLAGGIAHDFNNILSVILANAGLLDEGRRAERRDELRDLIQAAERGESMVRQLMGVARAEALRLRPVDLGEVVERLTRMLRRVLPAGVTVGAEVAPGIPAVVADRGAVEQMVLNLATNARDAMQGRGTLVLRVDRAPGLPDRIRLSVTDTGSGMDAETIRRVFEPFFTTKPAGVGTGLGLTMVRDLMTQHGGEVGVESAPGRGTTISLAFPVAAQEEPRNAAGPRPASPGALRGDETILVVEDEELLRRTARRVLEKHGYQVITADDGAQALAILRERGREVDLVFSDLVMPNVNGTELFRQAAFIPGTWRFLYASGYGRGETEMSAGIPADIPFIKKPWTLNELLGGVRGTLGGASRRTR